MWRSAAGVSDRPSSSAGALSINNMKIVVNGGRHQQRIGYHLLRFCLVPPALLLGFRLGNNHRTALTRRDVTCLIQRQTFSGEDLLPLPNRRNVWKVLNWWIQRESIKELRKKMWRKTTTTGWLDAPRTHATRPRGQSYKVGRSPLYFFFFFFGRLCRYPNGRLTLSLSAHTASLPKYHARFFFFNRERTAHSFCSRRKCFAVRPAAQIQCSFVWWMNYA